MATVAGVSSTSTNRLQNTVLSIPNARAVGPPTGRSTFFRPKFLRKPRVANSLSFGPAREWYYDPRTRNYGSGGPLRPASAPNNLTDNGLGAARGQRPR